MSPLRACSPPAHLQAVLDALPATKKGPSLPELYKVAWTDLPTRVLERKPPHLTQTELAQVLDYKLCFGQSRPALRGMIGALDDRSVVEASTEAFKLLNAGGSTFDALKALTVLRGVGPATASLVLSLLSPSVPFFSDEAAIIALRPVAGRKGLKYNEKEYREFLQRVEKIGGEGKEREWERRTWIEETAKTLGLDLEEAGSHPARTHDQQQAGNSVKQTKRKLEAGPTSVGPADLDEVEAPLHTGRRTRSRQAATRES